MDIICPTCGEPWDNDSIHERVAELNEDYPPTNYAEVAKAFRANGCKALGGRCEPGFSARPEVATIYELLGDDMDGAAALLEELAGGLL